MNVDTRGCMKSGSNQRIHHRLCAGGARSPYQFGQLLVLSTKFYLIQLQWEDSARQQISFFEIILLLTLRCLDR